MRGLVDHIVGLLGKFAAGAQGSITRATVAGDPVKAVRAASERILDGWRRNGTDRDVSVRAGVLACLARRCWA